jgi:hypothetical protein
MDIDDMAIPEILYDSFIPRDLTFEQKKEIYWQTNNPPLWMTIDDYFIIYTIIKKIKQLKNTWATKKEENSLSLIVISHGVIDCIRYKYFGHIYEHYYKLEFTYYSAHITDAGTIQIFPNNPELLLPTSKSLFKNKKLKCDPAEFEKFLMKTIDSIEYTISLYEHGSLNHINGKIILSHCYSDIREAIIEFPKWR